MQVPTIAKSWKDTFNRADTADTERIYNSMVYVAQKFVSTVIVKSIFTFDDRDIIIRTSSFLPGIY